MYTAVKREYLNDKRQYRSKLDQLRLRLGRSEILNTEGLSFYAYSTSIYLL